MPKTYAERVIEAMREQGISMAEVARRAGVSYNVVRELTRRSKTTSHENAVAISRVLGLDAPGAAPQVPVVAQIVADGIVAPRRGRRNINVTVSCPPQLAPQRLEALEVQDDDISPLLRKGGMVFVRQGEAGAPVVAAEDLGEVCVIEIADGTEMIREIRAGSAPGLYHLLAIGIRPGSMFDCAIKACARVLLYVPPGLI